MAGFYSESDGDSKQNSNQMSSNYNTNLMEPILDVENPQVVTKLKPSNANELGKNVFKRRSNLGSSSTSKKLKNLTNALNEISTNLRDDYKDYMKSSKNKISPSKQRRLYNDTRKTENENEKAIVTLNQEQLSDIYKLPIELLADIFDYLPIKDLCEVRRTSALPPNRRILFPEKLFCTLAMYSPSERYKFERLSPIDPTS